MTSADQPTRQPIQPTSPVWVERTPAPAALSANEVAALAGEDALPVSPIAIALAAIGGSV